MPELHKDQTYIMMEKTQKPQVKKYSFAETKILATSPHRDVRKAVFLEYFERFSEFPSYLFDNEREIHIDLWLTAQDILADRDSSKEVCKGIEQMINRLPTRRGATN